MILKKWRVKRLSTALRQALNDLRRRERSKKHVVNMSMWHEVVGSKCAVCLAGAKMCSLGATPDKYASPYSFKDPETQAMLIAMDHLRQGRVTSALVEIDREEGCAAGLPLDRKIVPYYRNRLKWWKQMRRLQRDLVAAGL